MNPICCFVGVCWELARRLNHDILYIADIGYLIPLNQCDLNVDQIYLKKCVKTAYILKFELNDRSSFSIHNISTTLTNLLPMFTTNTFLDFYRHRHFMFTQCHWLSFLDYSAFYIYYFFANGRWRLQTIFHFPVIKISVWLSICGSVCPVPSDSSVYLPVCL